MNKILYSIVLLSLIVFILNCKEKTESEPVSSTPQASATIDEDENHEDDGSYYDENKKIKIYKTSKDRPFLKDPKCVISNEAGLYGVDVTVSPTEPLWFASKLSRFPWVEINEDSAIVRYMESCSGVDCYYEEMYMNSEDLVDCKEVGETIIKMLKEKKKLTEVLSGLELFGSTMYQDGTSSIIYYNPAADEFSEDFGSMGVEPIYSSFKWKSKGSSLILDLVYGTEDFVSSGDGEGEHNCDYKDRFKTMHSGGYIDGYGCAYTIKRKLTCEITGATLSSDGRNLVLSTKLLASEPKAEASDCGSSISLEGHDPIEVRRIIE